MATPGIQFTLLPAGWKKWLLTQAQTPFQGDAREREKEEYEEMSSLLKQMKQQRARSEILRLLRDILKMIFAQREPALTAETVRDLEMSLDVPIIDYLDDNHLTPLMHAVMIGSIGYVRALLEDPEHRANPNLKDKKDRSALHIAVLTPANPIVPLLLKHNVELNGMDVDGQTPLMIACANNDSATIQLLLERNADINKTNPAGDTALTIALKKGHIDAVKILLRKGVLLQAAHMEILFPQRSIAPDAAPGNESKDGPTVLDKELNTKIQIAALLLSYNLSFYAPVISSTLFDALVQIGGTVPSVWLTFFESLQTKIDGSAQTALQFCMAEALRQKPPIDDSQRGTMLSLYVSASSGVPFIPAAARRLGNFELEKGNTIEAISFFAQATIGTKQNAVLKYFQAMKQKIASAVKASTPLEQMSDEGYSEIEALLTDQSNFDGDPFAWRDLIKTSWILADPDKLADALKTEIEESIRAKAKQDSKKDSTEIKTTVSTPSQTDARKKIDLKTMVSAPTAENTRSPKEDKEAKDQESQSPETLEPHYRRLATQIILFAHHLFSQISLVNLAALNDLTLDEWDHFIAVMRSDYDKFASREECGRMVFYAAMCAYQTCPLSAKDKMANIVDALQRLDNVFPEVVTDEKLAAVAPLDAPVSKSKKGYEFTKKKKEQLLTESMKLFLQFSSLNEQTILWNEIQTLIPRPLDELKAEEDDSTSMNVKLTEIPADSRLDRLLVNFALVSQKKRVDLLKKYLIEKLKTVAALAEKEAKAKLTIVSTATSTDKDEKKAEEKSDKKPTEQAQAELEKPESFADILIYHQELLQVLPFSPKEQLLQRIKIDHYRFYKDMLASAPSVDKITSQLALRPHDESTSTLALAPIVDQPVDCKAVDDPKIFIAAIVNDLIRKAEAQAKIHANETISTIEAIIETMIKKIEAEQEDEEAAFANEPALLLAFIQQIEGSDDPVAQPVCKIASDISARIISTGFPSIALTKIIFLLLNSTLIDREETEVEQEHAILQLIPAASFDPALLGFFRRDKSILSVSVINDISATLVNIPHIDCLDARGQTPLMHAASQGAIGFANALLKRANILAKDLKGRTALNFAVLKPENPVALRLLEVPKCDVNVVDPEGYSPLIRAVLNHDLVLAKMLLDKKATNDFADRQGNTALHHAAHNGQTKMVVVLLDYISAETINRRNHNGNTALLYAVKGGHQAVVKLLVDKGASVNLPREVTPLFHATKKGLTEISEVLLNAGAEVNFNPFRLLFRYKSGLLEPDYSEEKFDQEKFIRDCPNLLNHLKLAVLFLSRDLKLQSPEKFLALLEAIPVEKIADACEELNFCKAEALRQQHLARLTKEAGEDTMAVDMQILTRIKKLYQAALPRSYVARRLGQIAQMECEYKKAFNYFKQAILNEDPLAWHALIQFGYYIKQRVSESLALREMLENVEQLFLNFTFKSVSLPFAELSSEQWSFFALAMREKIQQGGPNNENVKVMVYAVHKCYAVIPICEKDEAYAALLAYNQLTSGTISNLSVETAVERATSLSLVPFASKQTPATKASIENEKTLHINILILLDLLTSDEQVALWQRVLKISQTQEAKRPTAAIAFDQLDPEKRKTELLRKLNVIKYEQRLALIKCAFIACFVIRCLRLDPEFNNPTQMLPIFKDLLQKTSLKPPALDLRAVLKIFAPSKREVCLQEIKAYEKYFSIDDSDRAEFPLLQVINTVLAPINTESKNTLTAAKNLQFYIIYWFSQLGVNLNLIKDVKGNWLLIRCLKKDNIKDLKYLLRIGVESNILTVEGVSALYYAVAKRKSEAVESLLSAKADPNFYAKNKSTALTVAAFDGNFEDLQKLLAYNPDLNWQDEKGTTALMYAVHSGKLDSVRLLLQKDALVDIANKQGVVPLHHAARLRRPDLLAALLEEGGANPRHHDSNGWTALDWVFAQQPPKPLVSYTDAKYDPSQFVKDCKDEEFANVLNCAYLLLSFNAKIAAVKKFIKFLDYFKDRAKTRKETWQQWNFCMGDALLGDQYLTEAKICYQTAELPAAERRLGEIAALRTNSFTAANTFITQALEHGDLLALQSLIQFLFTPHTLSQTAGLDQQSQVDFIEQLTGEVHGRILKITPQQIKLFKKLDGTQWCHVAKVLINHTRQYPQLSPLQFEVAELIALILQKLKEIPDMREDLRDLIEFQKSANLSMSVELGRNLSFFAPSPELSRFSEENAYLTASRISGIIFGYCTVEIPETNHKRPRQLG